VSPGERILQQSLETSRQLKKFVPSGPVHEIYNPLEYARAPWEEYLLRFAATPKRVVFLGMNPGPWGMAQTGIPFGEVAAVREWMGIDQPVGQPDRMHPKRPILGMACPRSEVSGRRLWGLFRERYPRREDFFREHIVLNYCPLVFMAETGRNITPDKLPKSWREELFSICDEFLSVALEALEPEFTVGVGAFARQRLMAVASSRVSVILHPSPASPAANRGWAERARQQLVDDGIWQR
jgi:single-strand selective monofunctional uracil DNA glycosylase